MIVVLIVVAIWWAWLIATADWENIVLPDDNKEVPQ